MKRIVVCCDGTWNRLDAKEKTNVAKLAEAILGTAVEEDGRSITQMVFHLDGVGSGRGTGDLARATDRLLGGVFGSGLDTLIEDAYRFLVLNYEPGDEIYLFGFSRGAYCARSLCGLIRRAGILERRHAGRTGEAMELYRAPGPGAATVGDRARRFRAKYASHVGTVPSGVKPDEATWRREHEPDSNLDPTPLRIAYLGVWDTVGSLGVPRGLLGTMFGDSKLMRRFRFHDTKLSPLIDRARHALAIDERRFDFEPTPWQLDDVRNEDGFNPENYRQEWFPGVHGAVGGGGPNAGLSSGALLWVLEGAEGLGLKVDGGMKRSWREAAHYDATLTAGNRKRGIAGAVFGLRSRDRDPVGALTDVSEIGRRRWQKVEAYRPAPLAGLADALVSWIDPLFASPTPTPTPTPTPDGEGPEHEGPDTPPAPGKANSKHPLIGAD